jgi:phasin protein
MSRIQRSAGDAGQSANPFLAMWNPFMAGARDGNPQALGEFGTIAAEWQDFVSRRLKEDVALVERLARSATPDATLDAYADFWRKAGEDYGKEITTMTKLMTDMTTRMVVAAQPGSERRE